MQTDDRDAGHDVALFRHGVIADVLRLPVGSPERAALVRAKAAQRYRIPHSRRTRIGENTIRRWVRSYRQGGFQALRPKPRSDRGRSRRIPVEVADVLKGIKEGNPRLSTRLVIVEARERGLVPARQKLAHETVHRLLANAGLTGERAKALEDCRHFCHEHANALWMSDVLHGPKVADAGSDRRRRRKSYLTLMLDDATRVVPYGEFHFTENAESLLCVLRQAIRRRGVPERCYVDNGANYRSRRLQVACASLNITLIHATPRRPQGKGKIERFFRTVRGQFLSRLRKQDLASLEILNSRFWAWVEGEYHCTPHGGLGAHTTPLDRWAQTSQRVRWPAHGIDLLRLFRPRHQRRVSRHRLVRFRNRQYEVGAAFAGRIVTLLIDPEAPPERPIEVECDGQPAGHARLVDPHANARRPPKPKAPAGDSPKPAARKPDLPDAGRDTPPLPLRRLRPPGTAGSDDPKEDS